MTNQRTNQQPSDGQEGIITLPTMLVEAEPTLKAFSPHGTAVGLQMGAKADTLVYWPGFLKWLIRAPCPPMECPDIA